MYDEKFQKEAKRVMVNDLIKKINKLLTPLSINGYSDESNEIKEIIKGINQKENPPEQKSINEDKVDSTFPLPKKHKNKNNELTFKYNAIDSAGKEVSGEVEAKDKKNAIIKIRGKGVFPTTVREL